jgi:hypothetical protein
MGITGTWKLPYQDGTDAPCDQATPWCQLVAIVDTVVQAAADYDGFGTTAPFAKAYDNDVISPDLDITLQGDRVPISMKVEAVDTDEMIDLATRPTEIRPRTRGIYYAAGYMEHIEATAAQRVSTYLNGAPDFVGAGNFTLTVSNSSTPAGFIATLHDPSDSIGAVFAWDDTMEGVAQAASSQTGSIFVARLELTVVKVGDVA